MIFTRPWIRSHWVPEVQGTPGCSRTSRPEFLAAAAASVCSYRFLPPSNRPRFECTNCQQNLRWLSKDEQVPAIEVTGLCYVFWFGFSTEPTLASVKPFNWFFMRFRFFCKPKHRIFCYRLWFGKYARARASKFHFTRKCDEKLRKISAENRFKMSVNWLLMVFDIHLNRPRALIRHPFCTMCAGTTVLNVSWFGFATVRSISQKKIKIKNQIN